LLLSSENQWFSVNKRNAWIAAKIENFFLIVKEDVGFLEA